MLALLIKDFFKYMIPTTPPKESILKHAFISTFRNG